MKHLINYIIFVLDHYINEDWSDVKKIGKLFLKPAWFIRSIFMWTYSIVCFPLILLHMYVENNKEKLLKEIL